MGTIAEEITRIQNAKADLKAALIRLGYPVDNERIDKFANILLMRPFYIDSDLKLHGDLILTASSIAGHGWESNTGIKSLTLKSAEGVTIGAYAFRSCSGITDVWIDKLTSIATEAFSSCGLSNFTIKNATEATFGGYVMRSTENATVKINGIPTSIGTTCFKYSSIEHLYVSWSEGEVDGAPWAATGAEIHYDTVFDEDMNIVTQKDPAEAES